MNVPLGAGIPMVGICFVSNGLDHQKTKFLNVRYSNVFGIPMFGVQAPTVPDLLGILMFIVIQVSNGLNLKWNPKSRHTSTQMLGFQMASKICTKSLDLGCWNHLNT